MKKTVISIILPVYNCEKFLSRCLEALLIQTYSNIEVLCINDGSTDKSLQILEQYAQKDSRIKVFSQENSGPAKARNLGLAKARGDYLMFCDSDDWYEPQMCECMLKTIELENVDLVICKANVKIQDNYDSVRTQSGSIAYHTDIFCNGKLVLNDTEIRKINTMLWNKIYKKEIVDRYSIKFPEGLEGDDTIFNIQYFTVIQNLFGLSENLYNYFIREDSIMDKYHKKNPEKLYDPILIFDLYFDFLNKNNLIKKREGLFISFIVHFFRTAIRIMTENKEKEIAVEKLFCILDKTPYKLDKYLIFKNIKKLPLDSLKRKLINMSDEDFLLTKSELFKMKMKRQINLLPVIFGV